VAEHHGEVGVLTRVVELVDLDVQPRAVVRHQRVHRAAQRPEGLGDPAAARAAEGEPLGREAQRRPDAGRGETGPDGQQVRWARAHESPPMWVRGTRAPIRATIS